jgi:F-type H+-transporting ATPase subunit alpha
MQNSLVEKIKKEIEHFSPTPVVEEVGTVVKVGDGVAEIEGLTNALMAEMVLFDEAEGKSLEKALGQKSVLYGLLLNLEEESVKAVILGDTSRVKEGMTVKRVGKILSVPVGEALIGRVVNALGEPIDGKGDIKTDTYFPVERDSYGVIDRSQVNTPVHTGIKAIDVMIPIGRGQRELIIGDRGTGKTTLAIDTILNQKNEPEKTRPICIYVAIGQKESKTARIVAELKERGAFDYTIIVSASASSPAALQFLAPYAGVSIAEYFMEQGKDAIIVYDDLSKQAVAYRQLSLLLRRPPGREAYPGDVFYLHSRLLERAQKLSKERGGGSITALPIIETQAGDISAYIPTNVISITDGQIFLDTDLFNKGSRPAINVGVSVTRVGSNAQTKAMKKVAGRIKLDLAQFRELEAFMQFSSDLDAATKKQLETGQRLSQVLIQGKGVPLPFERIVVLVYAAINGMFDKTAINKILETEGRLFQYMDREHKDIFADLREKREITPEIEGKMKPALLAFFEKHI